MKEIIENLKSGIDDHCTPSVSYGIINGNKIKIGAVGSMTYENPEENVTEDTLYDIASLSKLVVTVTLISKLVENGAIKLKDPVQKHLPGFKYSDVTIAHLLTHTSGLPADYESKEIIPRYTLLAKLYDTDKIYETETDVIYSDLGYMLLGELIEKKYNESLDRVAQKEIFEPLRMTSTCYCPTNKENCAPTEITEARGLVRGIVHDEKACSLGGVAGHAGVFTTAKDLSNFVSMILHDGMFDGKRFLSKEIIDAWFKPTIHEKRDAIDRWRSWCWITGNNREVSNKELNNTISFSGFTGPSIIIDRDKKYGIVLLDSRVYPTRDNKRFFPFRRKINDEIYDELDKENQYDYSD